MAEEKMDWGELLGALVIGFLVGGLIVVDVVFSNQQVYQNLVLFMGNEVYGSDFINFLANVNYYNYLFNIFVGIPERNSNLVNGLTIFGLSFTFLSLLVYLISLLRKKRGEVTL